MQLTREPRARAGLELAVVTIGGWAALVSIPVLLGHIGISWDALNHHIYLGWTAEHPRFGQDFLAASFQSYQFPYLYWPAYKLSAAGMSGAAAGAVLATLNATAIPAVWLVARSCIPGRLWWDSAMRVLAVMLAFCSGLVLSMFDSTSNDLLSAVPLVWSVALAMQAVQSPSQERWTAERTIAVSGLLAGVSVACKLSNGPIAVVGPVLWAFAATGTRRFRVVAVGCAGAVVGFLLAYGYWGWQLWLDVGNPVYPFADAQFEPLRQWLGWHR